MSNTYYIAWSPTSGHIPYTFTLDAKATRRIAKCNIGLSESIEIRAVRIVEEDKVRELWECFRDLSSCSYDHDRGVYREDVADLLDSILPEPKTTGEKDE